MPMTQFKSSLHSEKDSCSLRELISWAAAELAFLDPRESRASAEWMLENASGLTRSEIYLNANRKVSRKTETEFRRLISARKNRIPAAYLTGKAPFWNEILEVNEGCLIPRPETEILVEKFIENSGFAKDEPFAFLDLGAGSGAIGIALLRHFSQARAVFSDVSPAAQAVARRNLNQYDLLARSEIILSDLFENLSGRKWQAILSNPPYLAWNDWKRVEPEILKEPRQALDGGEDGLEFYRKLIHEAPAYLEPKGWLAVEVGRGQAEEVGGLFKNRGFENIQIFKDHASINRVVMGN
jgi:release factor glutamine methyltransferase